MPLVKGKKTITPGRITITRCTSGSGDSRVHVEIVDDRSGCVLVQAEMPVEAFGYVITGQGYVKCELECHLDAPIGKYQHLKTEVVVVRQFDYGDDGEDKKAAIEEAVTPFEVDGWTTSRNDVINHHHRTVGPEGSPASSTAYNVTFRRYRDEPQPKEEREAARDDPNNPSTGNRRKRKR